MSTRLEQTGLYQELLDIAARAAKRWVENGGDASDPDDLLRDCFTSGFAPDSVGDILGTAAPLVDEWMGLREEFWQLAGWQASRQGRKSFVINDRDRDRWLHLQR